MNRPKISGQYLDTGRKRAHSFDRRLEPIKPNTYKKLVEILKDYGEENVHLTVEIRKPKSAIISTIDNEKDAQNTIKNYKRR